MSNNSNPTHTYTNRPYTRHREAFCKMKYGNRDTKQVQLEVWNSRDDVTPFMLEEGVYHILWDQDLYAPNHIPKEGDSIFVDMPPKEYLAPLKATCVARMTAIDVRQEDRDYYELLAGLDTMPQDEVMRLARMFGWQAGAPALKVVGKDGTLEELLALNYSKEDKGAYSRATRP